MIDIPLNKAMVAVEVYLHQPECYGCMFVEYRNRYKSGRRGKCPFDFACKPRERKDGKNVIYKLVDYYPSEGWDLI